MKYIVLLVYITIVVFGSAVTLIAYQPPQIPKFCSRYRPILILIYQLQNCLKNLPILITNYIPFEKCTISNPQF